MPVDPLRCTWGDAGEVAFRRVHAVERDAFWGAASRRGRAFAHALCHAQNRLGAEQENLRVALEWRLRTEPEAALRLSSALGWFWMIRG